MSNPIEELMNGGMGGIQAFLTNKTCAEACWYAREDICRCSCGGKNHGCLKRDGAEQPQRTAIIDGIRYKLAAFGPTNEIYGSAEKINKAQPPRQITPWCKYPWRETEPGAPARVRKATQSQLERWTELSKAEFDIEQVKKGKYCMRDIWSIWPYLLWVRIDLEDKK